MGGTIDQQSNWRATAEGAATLQLIKDRVFTAANNLRSGGQAAGQHALDLEGWSSRLDLSGIPGPDRATILSLLDQIVEAFMALPAKRDDGEKAIEGLLDFLGRPG